MRKAVVRESDGLVLNVIEYETESGWPIPDGCILVDAETDGSTGDTWDGEKFISPPEPIPPPDYKAQWAAAVSADDKLMIIGKKLGLEE